MFKWVSKSANYVSQELWGITIPEDEFWNWRSGIPHTRQEWKDNFSKESIRQFGQSICPESSQQWGGLLSQMGNIWYLGSGVFVHDLSGWISMVPAIMGDAILSRKADPGIEMETKRYSVAAVFLSGCFWIMRESQGLGTGPVLKRAVTAQAILWAFGALRWPAHRFGQTVVKRFPDFGEGLIATAGVIPTVIGAISSFAIRPVSIYFSTDGLEFRMLTAQAFGFAADAMMGNVAKVIAKLRDEPVVEPIHFSQIQFTTPTESALVPAPPIGAKSCEAKGACAGGPH